MWFAGTLLGYSPYGWFTFGFLLPFGPLYVYFTSGYAMERRLKALKRWTDDGLIQAKESGDVRRRLLW